MTLWLDTDAAPAVGTDGRNGDRPAYDEGDPYDVLDDPISTWGAVDLTDAVYGRKQRPEPSVLARGDGRRLLYPGRVNGIHGGDGVGKSFVMLAAAVQEITAGNPTVWIDFEDPDEVTVVSRLRDLGVAPETILGRFHYVHPDSAATPAAVATVCDLVRSTRSTLVVIDSVGEAFGVDGVNEDRDPEVTDWIRRLPRPVAATGAAVALIDHGVKNGTNALHPSGSKRKRAAVSGASYLVEAVRTLSKEYGGGQLRLTCAKDRHGNFTRGKAAAFVDITTDPDGGMTFHITAPGSETTGANNQDLALARAAVRAVQQLCEQLDRPPSMKVVEQRMKGRASAKRAAVELAVGLGALREGVGPRNARTFTWIKDLDPEGPT